MIHYNKATALLLGLALIVLGNAVALTGIFYNRSGEPDAKVKLTQRELRLPYPGGFERDNSGIAFDLQWRVSHENSLYAINWGYPDWLNEIKLKELGFDTSIAKTLRNQQRYHKMLPREAYVVLEYNGPAYAAQLKRAQDTLKHQQQLLAEHPQDKQHRNDLKRAEAAVANEETSFSHLFAVDAGVDKSQLRRKYPNRSMYIIAAAQIRIELYAKRDGSPLSLTGRIQGLSIDSITAPYSIRQRLEAYLAKDTYAARQKLKYTVSVAYGKRLEPWIEDLTITHPTNQ